MLKKIQSRLSYHAQAANHSFTALLNKPLATFMTSIVIAIALALPALFLVCSDNMERLVLSWARGGHISVYLKTALNEEAQNKALAEIKNIKGVGSATMTTAKEGLAELTKQEGMKDIMHYLPENPLPAVIEVTPAVTINAPAKLDLLARQLGSLPEVEVAKLDMDWVNRLDVVLGFVSKASQTLLIILALAVVLIIATTLRLALHSRQEEIQVLKLIGASESYIIRPFLYSGLWYGLVGAVLAILLVNIFILSVGIAINKLVVVYQIQYPFSGLSLRQALLLVLFSAILGWLAARFSVKRQLSYIEPLS